MSVEADTNPPKGNVQLLLKKLVAVACFSIIIIIAGTGYGIYRVYSDQVLRSAEEDAAHIAAVLLVEQEDLLFTDGTDGQPVLFVYPMSLDTLDRRFRRFLKAFEIVKIKIYNADKMIIFSSEAALIGDTDTGNLRLERALQGSPDSHHENKEAFRDLANEEMLDVDVVESYIPIRIGNAVVGAFEIYADVTRYRKEIVTTVINSVFILGIILVGVFGVSFFFVKNASTHVREAQDKLHVLATIDALTGVYNRGAIVDRARKEISRIDRRRQQQNDYSLSFIMLDIDHFKKVNDTYGHLAGDQVLRDMALRIQETVRDYDQLGRYGGEEFLLVLPDESFESAVVAAERVRQAVRTRPFMYNDTPLPVTVSLGIATSLSGEENLDIVLQRADEGLYKAKAEGRDRAAWVEPSSACLNKL
ncbi:MAG: diguanylate cyclase [Desulfuromonadales bacterium]|nr:diguanylate cyclase [Desulfuromonadales bacterium]